ncbi:MlaD family protein [Cesiribacter sp. SM1]|uniref:MlaD family protein n=1 Tax=Cesiribacter sp. SM1 TaxID=2861196 RepID=UPI001CD6891E|nr:MlaD family protein [Cesiribacter sp. SM1]
MSEQDNRRNARLGFFVLIGVIVFLIGIFFIGSARNLFSSNITLYVLFNNVSGLQRGNNIWLSGVKIGTVSDVDIATDSLVLVSLKVRERDQKFINKDAKAYLSSEGLVGNSIIVIEPGQMRIPVEDGDTIGTKYTTSTEDIINLAQSAGEQLIEVAGNLGEVTQQLLDGNGTIGMLLSDTTVADDFRSTLTNLEATSQRTRSLSNEVGRMVNRLQNNEDGPVYTLMNDTTFADTYSTALSNIEETTANAAQVTQELQRLSEQLQREDNAVGVLLKDPEFARDLQRTMDNAAAASRKLDENMEALQSNILFRGFFRRRAREAERARKDSLEQVNQR